MLKSPLLAMVCESKW